MLQRPGSNQPIRRQAARQPVRSDSPPMPRRSQYSVSIVSQLIRLVRQWGNRQEFRINNRLTLSTGNLLQLYLLRRAYPETQYTQYHSPFDVADLRVLEHYPEIQQAIDQLLRELQDNTSRAILADGLRNFYTQGYRYYAPQSGQLLSSPVSAQQIAETLEQKYYQELELTHEDIRDVILAHCDQQEIKALTVAERDQLIASINQAKVDQGRYSLQMLLPDSDIVKNVIDDIMQNDYQHTRKPFVIRRITQAIQDLTHYVWSKLSAPFTRSYEPSPASLQQSQSYIGQRLVAVAAAASGGSGRGDDDIERRKQAVSRELGKYICWWKMSLFGHHHDGRARAVRAAILHCSTRQEIQDIVLAQQIIMEQGRQAHVAQSPHLADRWSSPRQLVNQSADSSTSGYYQAITRARRFC